MWCPTRGVSIWPSETRHAQHEKCGWLKGGPQGCSLRSHRRRRLAPLPPPFSQPLCSAMSSMHRCCSSELKRRPERPRGWFNNWRLLQRGPDEFEKILAVTAANPRAPKGMPGGAPNDRGDLADDRRARDAREAVRTPPVTTKKKSPTRVRGKSGKRSH